MKEHGRGKDRTEFNSGVMTQRLDFRNFVLEVTQAWKLFFSAIRDLPGPVAFGQLQVFGINNITQTGLARLRMHTMGKMRPEREQRITLPASRYLQGFF